MWTLRKYKELSKFVDEISNIFGFYTLTQLGFSIPSVVIESFIFAMSVTKKKDDILTQVQFFLWLVSVFGQVVTVCYTAFGNAAAMEISKEFYEIYVNYICQDDFE